MDTTLKQRLIGAVVLIALAVIFLPMLVQGPAPDSGVADVSLRVPDAPAGDYETRELPLNVPAAAAGQAALPAAESATPAAEGTTAAPAGAAATSAPAAATPDPAVAAGNWAVSFGAYASARDADAVLSRLRQAGLKGFSEQATVNGRQAWRVRVGPYPDRALAEAGRLQAIRIRQDVNAQVIALDAGDAAAPAPSAASTAPAGSQAQPASPSPAVRSEALPADPVPARATTTATTAPQPARPAATPPAATPTATPAPSRPAAQPAEPAASSVGFAVQMGAFSRESDATSLRDRLRAAGYSAIVQPVRTDKGTLSRVRVGPVATRAEAEQLKSRLAGGFGPGMVVSHP